MKRSYGDRREKSRSQRKKVYRSDKPDNRNFCLAISRPKFCYETYEKAKRACKYSPKPQRIYYCKFCCAYHTTSILSKTVFEQTHSAKVAEHMQAELARRKESRSSVGKIVEKRDKKYLRREKTRLECLQKIYASDYSRVLSNYLMKYYSIPGDEDIGKLSNEDFALVFDYLTISRTPKVQRAIDETLRYYYRNKAEALVAFVLFCMEYSGDIVASSEDEDFVTILFGSGHMSPRNHNKANRCIRELIDKNIIVVTKMSSGYDIYSLGG